MAQHEPKYAALMALEEGALSAVGQRRIEAHLAGCQVCSEAVEVMRGYEALRAQVADAPVPEVDFAKMELGLRREASRVAQAQAPSSTAPMLAAVAVAAVVLLGVWLRPTLEPQQPLARSGRSGQDGLALDARAAEAAPLAATLTALGGDARVDDGPATLGATVRQGATLQTPAASTLHLRLSEGTGIALAPSSKLTIEGATQAQVALRLLAGSVDCKVSKLATEQRFVVHAGAATVRVRGTHFRVTAGQPARVELIEGRVEVSVDGTRAAVLQAPAQWPQPASADAGVEAGAGPVLPAGLSAAAGRWPTLSLPIVQDVRRWSLLDSSVEAAGALKLHAPPGELKLTAHLADGRSVDAVWQMLPEGLSIDERELSERMRIRAERVRRGHLDSAQIAPVVRAGTRKLQRCYEQALKRDASLRPRLTLRITVDPSGRVARSKLVGDTADDLADCVQRVAAGFRFPSPGGGSVTFNAPLRFKQRQ